MLYILHLEILLTQVQVVVLFLVVYPMQVVVQLEVTQVESSSLITLEVFFTSITMSLGTI